MKRLGMLAVAGAVMLMAMPAANAQYFFFTTTFDGVAPPGPAVVNVTPVTGTDYLNVTPGYYATAGFAGGAGSDIVLANLETVSTTPDNNPLTINHPYSIFLTMQQASDSAGHAAYGVTDSFTFTGTLLGTISQTAANVGNTFGSPISHGFNLNGNLFTVTLTTYVAPQKPGSTNFGSIGAHVAGPLEQGVPEPGTLGMLLGSGIGSSLLFIRRRKA